jgi:hypothetical protein
MSAEITAWYPPGDEGLSLNLDSGEVDKPKTKKSKESKDKKGKNKSKRSKDLEESLDSDSEQTIPKRPRVSLEQDTESWKSSMTNSLAQLTMVVQQLASSQMTTQSQMVSQNQEKAPPVPPRSQEQRQLIEDVREFVRTNASTPTPSERSKRSGSGKSNEDQTIQKQRPLPKAPIPRKSQEASGSSGRARFQFSTVMRDLDDVYDSEVEVEIAPEEEDEVEVEPLYEPPPQPEMREMDIGRIEKRKMYLSGLKNMVPDLEVTKPPTNKSGRFEFLDPKPKENTMPFLEEMFQQISLATSGGDKKTRDPFTQIPRFYPTTEPAESGVLQGREVPRQIVNLVKGTNLVTQGASGNKAQLKIASAEGMRDEAAKRSFKQASSYLRLVNNLEIDVEVMTSLSDQISNIVSDLEKLRGLPVVAQGKVLQLSQKTRLIQKAIFDVKSTNSDFARAALHQYQTSLHDRRNAWINASMMLKGAADELKAADFPNASHLDTTGKLPMFGPEGTRLIKEYDELAKDGRVPVPFNYSQGSGKSYGKGNSQFKAGHFSGYYNQPQGQGHGHGQGYSFRGGQGGNRSRGGRPNNRRPRNNFRGGRGGRGQYQPFNQANKPQHKE